MYNISQFWPCSQVDLLRNKTKVNLMLKNCCVFVRQTTLLVSLILTCLLLSGLPFSVYAQSTTENNELTQLKALATALNNHITNLEMNSTTLQQQIAYLQAADQSLQDEVNRLKPLNQTLKELQEEVGRWQKYAASLEADNQALQNQVDNLQNQV